MKKEKLIKAFKFLLCIIFTLVSVHLIYDHYNVKKPKPGTYIEVKEQYDTDNTIKALQEEYDNPDIKAYLEISNLIGELVVKPSNNDYYLNHDLYQKENEYGTIFIDKRTNTNSKILILYGNSKHRDPDYVLFDKLLDKEFYTFNKTIDLYTGKNKFSYEIFSAFTEEEDLDYYNTNNYGNISYVDYLNKLKDKSIYDTDVTLDNNSKIIIIKLSEKTSENNQDNIKYTLIMGVLKN